MAERCPLCKIGVDHICRLVTGADRLSEAEREALLETLIGGLPIRHGTTRADRARDILPTVEALLASLTAERDAALAAVTGIEEVARRVLGEHGEVWGDVGMHGWECMCGWGNDDSDRRTETDFRAHQAERIASELRGES